MRQIADETHPTYALLVMRSMVVVLIAFVLGGCLSNPAIDPPVDGSVPPKIDASAGCPELPAASTFRFDLGPCTPDPNPQVNVVCGVNDTGWCEGGTCRPMAYAVNGSCSLCPSGTLRYATGGAAYCEP